MNKSLHRAICALVPFLSALGIHFGAWGQQAADLKFPSETSTLSVNTRPQMALYKPEGAGPFPAIVLVHQCGGLGTARYPNESMVEWARQAVGQGYVALVLDVFGQRGVDTVCLGAKGGVSFGRGAKDAYQAADHLRTLPFVDAKRIGLAGYSWGAMVGILAASNGVAASNSNARFAAIVSFYPGCFTIKPANGSPYELMRPDIKTPLLVLMGADDTETPPGECIEKLTPVRNSGAPIEMHTYPDITHCWDCKHLNNFTKNDWRGSRVSYIYSESATTDSRKRMFDFFAKAMANGS
jgi:dienelactone hydrolase